MSQIKGFDKSQVPVAMSSVILVALAMVVIMLFGENTALSVETPNPETDTTISEQKENTSDLDENITESETTTQVQPETTTAPPVTQEMEYTVQSSIVIQGDRAMEIYSVAPNSLNSYASAISTFAKRVPSINIYVLLAPTAIEFYGPESYRTGSRSQAEGIDIVYKALTDSNIKTVNALSEIKKHTSEYVYFRTDHHWTARGAYYAYRAFCKTAGFTPTKLEDHRTGMIEGFVGSMYTYTSAQVLRDNPDYVEYFYPITEASGFVYTDATMANGRPLKIISEEVSSRNKYLTFLEGDNPLEKITTTNANGKKVAVIKESFGNAFVPFIIDHYEEVYVIDPRRVDMDLYTFVADNGITDVIFINYPFVPSNKTYCRAMNAMLGA